MKIVQDFCYKSFPHAFFRNSYSKRAAVVIVPNNRLVEDTLGSLGSYLLQQQPKIFSDKFCKAVTRKEIEGVHILCGFLPYT